jgi:hypothetical protein
MAATEAILTVLYDGMPMVEALDDGSHRTVSAGINRARIAGECFDVINKLGPLLSDLRQQVKCGTINPYRDAVLLDGEAVLKEIPREARAGMRPKDIGAVLNAIHAIAKRNTQ